MQCCHQCFKLTYLSALDLSGTAVFAASGALVAREQQRNQSYAILYAVLTALGGGTFLLLLGPSRPVFSSKLSAY